MSLPSLAIKRRKESRFQRKMKGITGKTPLKGITKRKKLNAIAKATPFK
jgi:hypothetical protein